MCVKRREGDRDEEQVNERAKMWVQWIRRFSMLNAYTACGNRFGGNDSYQKHKKRLTCATFQHTIVIVRTIFSSFQIKLTLNKWNGFLFIINSIRFYEHELLILRENHFLNIKLYLSWYPWKIQQQLIFVLTVPCCDKEVNVICMQKQMNFLRYLMR